MRTDSRVGGQEGTETRTREAREARRPRNSRVGGRQAGVEGIAAAGEQQSQDADRREPPDRAAFVRPGRPGDCQSGVCAMKSATTRATSEPLFSWRKCPASRIVVCGWPDAPGTFS